MEVRLTAMEATVSTLTDQLNDYSGKIARLLKLIEDNDTGTKQAVQTEITGIQAQISTIEQTYQAVKSAGSTLDSRVWLKTQVSICEYKCPKVSSKKYIEYSQCRAEKSF